jgi:TPR repeat protein
MIYYREKSIHSIYESAIKGNIENQYRLGYYYHRNNKLKQAIYW